MVINRLERKFEFLLQIITSVKSTKKRKKSIKNYEICLFLVPVAFLFLCALLTLTHKSVALKEILFKIKCGTAS